MHGVSNLSKPELYYMIYPKEITYILLAYEIFALLTFDLDKFNSIRVPSVKSVSRQKLTLSNN